MGLFDRVLSRALDLAMGEAQPLNAGHGAAAPDAGALKRALELNPDLAIAHKLYAQLDVDRGRAQKAMERLLGRARTAENRYIRVL